MVPLVVDLYKTAATITRMQLAATAKGTKSYFNKYPAPHRPLGDTGLEVSVLGFGCYRISEDEPDHREALKQALKSGINLIDTSTNYGDGSSERLIGDVLIELFAAGDLSREQIVVVSKAGYVQGSNMREAKRRIENRIPYPEMVEYSGDCWHCIAPEFLRDQISNSLMRLKLERLDVLLLHNPEYFLKTSPNRKQFLERIERAFVHLESECSSGRISHYGVSSNGFPLVDGAPEYVGLQDLLEIAKKIGAKHFSVIQLPLNLFETGGALICNNGDATTLDLARRRKLGVLINRPFNSFARGRLFRLAPFTEHDQVEIKGELHRLVGKVIELENRLPKMQTQGLQWAHLLRDKLAEMDDVLVWRDLLSYKILPSLSSALARVPATHQAVASEYRDAMLEFLGLISKDLEGLGNNKMKVVEEHLLRIEPKLRALPTLSQKALAVYLGLPGVTSVLVGMREPRYVQNSTDKIGQVSVDGLKILSGLKS